ALRLPLGRPERRALDDRVRVDRVDANRVLPALLRQAPREMERGRLRRRVRGRVRAGDERVLRADEDDRAAPPLLDQDAKRLTGREEVAPREDGVASFPIGERGL